MKQNKTVKNYQEKCCEREKEQQEKRGKNFPIQCRKKAHYSFNVSFFSEDSLSVNVFF
tara:strand:+ start:257 stop:430 length:174 start_codon:yes stop_codon:yes gene_type:complete